MLCSDDCDRFAASSQRGRFVGVEFTEDWRFATGVDRTFDEGTATVRKRAFIIFHFSKAFATVGRSVPSRSSIVMDTSLNSLGENRGLLRFAGSLNAPADMFFGLKKATSFIGSLEQPSPLLP